jgi:HSP20 family protein
MKMWDNPYNQYPWKPISKEMGRLMQEINSLWEGGFTPWKSLSKDFEFPPVNMFGNEEQLLVIVEIPGINPEDLNIQALEDMLSLQCKRNVFNEEKIVYHRCERATGDFKRVFKLPFRIDPNKVEAKYEKGILQIVLPRSEQDKPKLIKIAIS